MSGRFPGSDDVNEYWQNISQGVDLVTEVPKERWDIDAYYDLDFTKLDKTNSRWGGFLADIDKFDPVFFNISGMEAEVMDPQQRLFLEECWKALEDAGYANDKISRNKCGVYVGAAPRDYLISISENEIPGTAQAFWGNTGSVLASRISYFLNLKGPAVAVDTACSSSLVSVHLAYQAVVSGEVDMAIAGGVWVCTTPHYYVLTSNAGMLSPDGKCKTFDNEANGIVNGEAVGAIILKPLDKAIKDRDHIYGVIRSSGINQDGKTNGITAPSSLSQTELELEVYRKGNIHPETITYVEAHGTGTKLGDPIEIEALKNAFKEFTDKKHFCAIGSVKTNIGHASLAAGIASIIKVLLTLKYKKIPPSLNFNKVNEHIDFEDSPFFVNTTLRDWASKDGLRRAAVSSFGLGGTNAHLVIDEFQETRQSKATMPFYIAAFSAKTSERLEQRLRDFLAWSEWESQAFSMGDICYSLNNCRKHFPVRLAFVVKGREDLYQKIRNFLSGKQGNNITSEDQSKKEILNNSKVMQQFLMELKKPDLPEDTLEKILLYMAEFYQNGGNMNWDKLYYAEEHLKVPLPTYPFAREAYWITEKPAEKISEKAGKKLHPLIDENISSLKEQRFQTYLKTDDILMQGCRLAGQQSFPVANYLEMVLAAGEIAGEKKVKFIEETACASPVIYSISEHLLKTCLYPDGDDCYVEIAVVDQGEEKVCAQAKIIFDNEMLDYSTPNTVDIYSIRKKYTETKGREKYYSYLNQNFKLEYGESFRPIKELLLNSNKTEALAELAMPDILKTHTGKFVLNPAFLEASYQASLGLIQPQKAENVYYFSGLDRFEIHQPLSDRCFIHTVLSGSSPNSEDASWWFTIRFINPDGTISLTIDNFSIRGF
jgi:Polyketide synthase modules and related proteins